MTDIEMLPLPEGEAIGWTQAWGHDQMRAYARAVAEHNVKERDAEIEALRAEVNTAKGQAEFYRITRNWSQQKADRLAEVLAADRERWEAQKAGAIRDQAGGLTRADPAAVARCDAAIQRIDAALRDHDQEGGNP